MIELDGIRRDYGDFVLDVSFRVGDDELVTLLGPSGSGKTTTLRIIAGFERSERGSLTIDGRDISALPARRRDIGYVFQDYTLFPHLDVAENIAYGLRVFGVPRVERGRRVEELLELIGLPGFGPRAVHTLSGGEQQRVAVARALARRPRALLLDEPFSSVDSERREELLEYLLRLQRNFSIPTVFVTHSRTDAMAISDRIVIMKEGRVDDDGSPRRLYESPASVYTARALGPAIFLDAARTRMVRPEAVELLGGCGEVGAAVDGPAGEREADTGRGRGDNETAARGPDGEGEAEAGRKRSDNETPARGPDGEAETSSSSTPADIPVDTEIDGVVLRSIYRGAWFEHRVDTGYGTIAVIDDAACSEGEPVRLRIPAGRVVNVRR